MATIGMLGVPTSAAAHWPGQEKAPRALRDAGLPQRLRDAGLDVADRIALTLDGPSPVLDAVRTHEAFVAGEVLATSVTYAAAPDPTLRGTVAAPDGTSAELAALVVRA